MISVKTESIAMDNRVRRRYEVTLIDLLGNAHTEVLGMFNHDKSDNGSAVEDKYLESKKEQEIQLYKSDIINGTNPFIDYEFIWNEKAVLLKAVLDDALSLPATNPIVYNGLQYLAFVTDAELISIYGKTQEWVNTTRAQANKLLAAKAILDDYRAVL